MSNSIVKCRTLQLFRKKKKWKKVNQGMYKLQKNQIDKGKK